MLLLAIGKIILNFLSAENAITTEEESCKIAVEVKSFVGGSTMDRINQYRQIICEFLEHFASDALNAQLIFDQQRDRYLVMHNEWRNNYRIYIYH